MWRMCGLLSGLLFAGSALAGEMPREYRSARYLGMGDAGVSLAEGHDALFYNPAGMADVKTLVNEAVLVSPQVTLSSNAKTLYKDIKDNKDTLDIIKSIRNKPEHLGVQNFTGMVFRRAALGVLQKADVNAFVGTDPTTGLLGADLKSVGHVGLYAGFGRAFVQETLLLGATVKVSHKAQVDLNVDALSAEEKFKNTKADTLMSEYLQRGTAVGADLGAIWKLSGEMKPRLGLTVRNVGTTTYSWPSPSTGTAPSPDKQEVDLGFSVAPGTKRSYSVLSVDFRDALNVQKESIYKRLHLGARLSFEDIMGFSIGLNQGYPTYGGFLAVKVFRFEGGMYSEELESFPGDRRGKRVFGRISVGWMR